MDDLLSSTTVPLHWNVSEIKSYVDIPLVHSSNITCVELQRIGDPTDNGIAVVLHRPDGSLEVYYSCDSISKGWVELDPAFSNLNISYSGPTHFQDAQLEIEGLTAKAKVEFFDVRGKKICVDMEIVSSVSTGPMFVPATKSKIKTQLRFMFVNKLGLLTNNRNSISISYDGAVIQPRRIFPLFSNLLSGRIADEVVMAALCSPSFAKSSSPCLGKHGVVDNTQLFLLHLKHTGQRDVNRGQGKFSVLSHVGEVATGKWKISLVKDQVTFSAFDIKQDWRPAHFSIYKQVLRFGRLYKRRNERWLYNYAGTIVNSSLVERCSSWDEGE